MKKILFESNTKGLEGKNCYAYALDLQPILSAGQWIAPMGLDIWDWLILGVIREDPNGELMVYFKDNSEEPIHMGIVEGEKIISKWRDSHVYIHEKDSTEYGRNTKRYTVPDRDELLSAWEQASSQTMNNLELDFGDQ